MPSSLPSSLVDGVIIRMAGRDFTVPPLTFGQLRKLQPVIDGLSRIGASMTPAEMDGVIDLVAAALSRNYPELNREAIEELLDLGNVAGVVRAILTGSGLVERTAPGE